MNKIKAKKGITLVSLIITIVVLIILSAVTINTIQNDDIVGKTKDTKEGFEELESNENKMFYDYYKTLLKRRLKYDSQAEGLTSVSTVELNKTIKDKFVNYRIYGNAEGVGDKVVNIFDVEHILNNNSVITNRIHEETGRECISWVQNANAENIKMLEGKFEENTIYNFSGYITSSTNRLGYLYVVYTDGTEEIVMLDNICPINTAGEFVQFSLYIGNASKTISHIRGNYNAAQRLYLDVDSLQIINAKYADEQYREPGKIEYRVQIRNSNSLNLFDKEDYNEISCLTSLAENTNLQITYYVSSSSAIQRVYVIPCKPNTTYTVSKEIGSFLRVYTSEQYPANGIECQTMAVDDGSNVITITTRENDKYLGFYIRRTTETSLDVNEILGTVMVVEGAEKFDYEPFKGETINIYLKDSLKEGEYLDFREGKVIKSDGTTKETVRVQSLQAMDDYTKIDVITEVTPSRIELEYVGYTF